MKIEVKGIHKVYGIRSPWKIYRIETDHSSKEVEVHVSCTDETVLKCPKCEGCCLVYDRRVRRWHHLDTAKYRTWVVTELPRVDCPEHGVVTVGVPWAQRDTRMTYEFEAMVIDGLQEATTSAVARLTGLSWTAVDGVMKRTVARGLARRKAEVVPDIGIYETSYKKGHNYITCVIDAKKGIVLYAGEGRTKESVATWHETLSAEQLGGIRSVSMDMWKPFITTAEEYVPDAKEKIAFDRFHVAKCVSEGVDTVRKRENRELIKAGQDDLKGTKYDWLMNQQKMSEERKVRFTRLRKSSLKTARAWALKDTAQKIWSTTNRSCALKGWNHGISWAKRCRCDLLLSWRTGFISRRIRTGRILSNCSHA